ncbi:MAG TPA: dephospho-CoA kinase [Chitinophagaceae bacterium]|nr:dephospho-CoA kinase [Chitinophagaceae bacterium]
MGLRIGLTGGIGSGKTTVAKIFELLGVPVYYADDAAKRIMNENAALRSAIQKHFGEQSYANGRLDRSYLASKVFNDPLKLELLNSLVHPVTLKDSAGWMEKQEVPYTLKEAALIFESGAAKQLDFVVGVYAPVTLRISRAMQRNNFNHEEVIKRMESQLDENVKMKLCDFVLQNDEQQLLIPQVIELHQKILQLTH